MRLGLVTAAAAAAISGQRLSAYAEPQARYLPPTQISPCSILKRSEIASVTSWRVGAPTQERYHMPKGAGTVCTYEAPDGSVIVTLPEYGSSFLGTNPLVEPQLMGETMKVHGVGDSAEIFDGAIFITRRNRNISIKLLPENGQPSNDALVSLARIAVRRLH